MKNLISSFLVKVFIKKGKVISNQKVGDHFQYLTISLPQKKDWIPGDKVQIKVNGTNLRSYTPISFSSDQKTFTTLIYNHKKGPGSIWSVQVQPNTKVEILGPRRSLNTDVMNDYIFVGDETTFGLVKALLDHQFNLKYYLKMSNPEDIESICHLLKLNSANFYTNYEAIFSQILIDKNKYYILSGSKDVISNFEIFLTYKGIDPTKIIKKTYWFNKNS